MRPRTLLLACTLIVACSRQAPPAAEAPPPHAAPSLPAATAASAPPGNRGGQSAEAFFDRRQYPDAVVGTFVDPKTLTASQQRYGIAPRRDAHVTYAADVILMEHGDEAIRSIGSDGVTTTFDAKAEHVGEFAEGRILFATGRVVGRIGQLTREGDTVTVRLAPVQITDVIENGQFMIESTLDTTQLSVHMAPDFPQMVDFNAEQPQALNVVPEPGGYAAQPANFLKTQAVLPSQLGKDLMPKAAAITQGSASETLTLDGKSMTARAIHGGLNNIGISYVYQKNGTHVDASGELIVGSPKVKFLLDISLKQIKTFGIDITGSLSLKMGINAWSDTEKLINANIAAVPAFDIDLPCPIAGVPMYLSFHTSFGMHTGFSAKKTVLNVSGNYTLTGHLFAGYKDGSKSFDYPTAQPVSKLVENVSGIAMGISSLGGSFNIRPMIGIGAFGFQTGVFLGVGFSGNALNQSSAAMGCHGADLTGRIDSGVGYQISGFLKTLINAFLRIFCKYEIEGTGTLIPGPGGEFIKIDEDLPPNCANMSGGQAPSKT